MPNKLLLMESEHYDLKVVKESLLAPDEFENSDEQTLILDELGERIRHLLREKHTQQDSPKPHDPRDTYDYIRYKQKFVGRAPPAYARWREEHKFEFTVQDKNITTTYPGITWEEYTNFLGAYQRKGTTLSYEFFPGVLMCAYFGLILLFPILFLFIPMMHLTKRTTIYRGLMKKFESNYQALVKRRLSLIRHELEVEKRILIKPNDDSHTYHINLGQLFQVKGTLFKLAGYVSGDQTVLMLRQEFLEKDGLENDYISRFDEPKLTILTLDEFCNIYTGTGLEKSAKWWNDRTLFSNERWA